MKKWDIIFVFFVFIILSSVFVSAYSFVDLRKGGYDLINIVVDVFEPFLQVVLGAGDYTGYLLFEKFLIFVLILSIVYLALKRVPALEDQKGIIWTIAIIVSILSVRFINVVWINTILIQYQVLGIAITAILPFLIYLFFLHGISESPVVRKIGWIFFIVVYFGLWFTNETETYGAVYFWTALLSFVFLLLDGTIHKYFIMERLRGPEVSTIRQRIAEIDRQLNNIEQSNLDERSKRQERRRLAKIRRAYIKQL